MNNTILSVQTILHKQVACKCFDSRLDLYNIFGKQHEATSSGRNPHQPCHVIIIILFDPLFLLVGSRPHVSPSKHEPMGPPWRTIVVNKP